MIINNAEIAMTLLSAGKPANGADATKPLIKPSEPSAVGVLASGGAREGAPSDRDAFAVKFQQSLLDKQIQNRLQTEETREKFDKALDDRNTGGIIFSVMKLTELMEERGLLSDAVEKKLNALADKATQELSLQGLEALAETLKEQGVSDEEVDDIVAEVKASVSEQTEAELSDEAAAEDA